MAEDAFSGQIIVCCVIVAFIAAFLLREWIMANQPHVHVGDQAGAQAGAVQAIQPADQAQRNQVLREALERVQAAREAHMADPGQLNEHPQFAWMDDLRRRLEQEENQANNERDETHSGDVHVIGGPAQDEDDQDLPFGHEEGAHHARPNLFLTANGEEGTSSGAIRRRAWSSEPDLGDADRATSPLGSVGPRTQAEASTSRAWHASEDLSSGSTSPLTPLSASPASSPRFERRMDSDDFGVESASDGELEDDEPLAAPLLGPAPAPNAARRGGHAHDIGNDSDSEDEEEVMFGPAVGGGAGPAGNPAALDDPILFDADDNPDDLFFEADLQGILEAVGIHGPILALLQNVALVSLLISCLLVCAIWIPLMFGKTIAAVSLLKSSLGRLEISNEPCVLYRRMPKR